LLGLAIFLLVIVSIVFSLNSLIFSVNAAPVEIDVPNPIIIVSYDEQVTITGCSLRTADNLADYDVFYVNNGVVSTTPGCSILSGQHFEFQTDYLPNDEYKFTVEAIDEDGNTITDVYELKIFVDGFDVWLLAPLQNANFAIGDTSSYNLQIQTEYGSTCKYGLYSAVRALCMGMGDSSKKCLYDHLPREITDKTQADTIHTIYAFSPGWSPGYYNKYAFVCLRNSVPSSEELNYGWIDPYVGYQDVPPRILSLSSGQNPVIDKLYRKNLVTLVTDQPTVCRINYLRGYSGSPSYSLNALFDSEDQLNYYTYIPDSESSSHTFTLEYNTVSHNNNLFEYDISCYNHAQSEVKYLNDMYMPETYPNSYPVTVNYISTVDILQTNPIYIDDIDPVTNGNQGGSYADGYNIDYVIRTNIYTSDCSLRINSDLTSRDMEATDEGKLPDALCEEFYCIANEYSLELTLPSQTNTIHVTCNGMESTATESFTILIDTADPTLTITAPSSRCDLNTFTVTLHGVDTESRINHYEYSVNGGTSESIDPGDGGASGTDAEFTITPTATGAYTITATAYDNSGRISAVDTETVTVYASDSPNCDTIPPTVTASYGESSLTGVYTATITASCTDNPGGSGCKTNFNYDYIEWQTENANINCIGATYAKIGSYATPIPVYNPGVFCIQGCDNGAGSGNCYTYELAVPLELATCGNGDIEYVPELVTQDYPSGYREDCDPDVSGALGLSCTALTNDRGIPFIGGTLACYPAGYSDKEHSECQWDTSNCDSGDGYCGDKNINDNFLEQCDGNPGDTGGYDWAGIDDDPDEGCRQFGFDGGTLACYGLTAGSIKRCTFDVSKCTLTSAHTPPYIFCGDTRLSVTEQCDSSIYNPALSCEDFGYMTDVPSGKSIDCYSTEDDPLRACMYNLNGCLMPSVCGDGEAEGAEQCDGSDLNGISACAGLNPSASGSLSCHPRNTIVGGVDIGCTYDESACSICGNDIVEGDEQCDGNIAGTVGVGLDGNTCTNRINALTNRLFVGGILSCTSECEFDESNCDSGGGYCGDNILNNVYNEQCDGTANWGADITPSNGCTKFGFTGGSISCYSSTDSPNLRCKFNTEQCTPAANSNNICAMDNVGSSSFLDDGEQCDTGHDSLTCEDFADFVTGSGSGAACSNCMYDLSECQAPAECGDGHITANVEDCDFTNTETDLNNNDCITLGLGFDAGTLQCHPENTANECTYDTSQCSICGDNSLDGGEQCDGSDLNGLSCSDFAAAGYVGGILGCSGCSFDLSNCDSGQGYCGDNISNNFPYEQCDGTHDDGDWGRIDSCENFGFDSGTLECYPATASEDLRCRFDTRACTVGGTHVNECSIGETGVPSILDYATGEQCESGISELQCSDFSSNLRGLPDCLAGSCFYDISSCTPPTPPISCEYQPECSAGQTAPCSEFIDPDTGVELCGTAVCLDDCTGWDISSAHCSVCPVCGNGVLEQYLTDPYYEECEPNTLSGAVLTGTDILDGQTCFTLLGSIVSASQPGALLCGNDCKFVTTNCNFGGAGYCGDNLLDVDSAEKFEQCDGTYNPTTHNWGDVITPSNGCQLMGFDSGTLLCNGPQIDYSCTFNTSGCRMNIPNAQPFCGLNSYNGVSLDTNEQCDYESLDFDLGCEDFDSFTQGIIGCNELCYYDISSCRGPDPPAVCSDNNLETSKGEICQPDGGVVGDCQDYYLSSTYGTVYCNNCVDYNTEECAQLPSCGNNNVENIPELNYVEQCDSDSLPISSCSGVDILLGHPGNYFIEGRGYLECYPPGTIVNGNNVGCTYDASNCDSGYGYCGDSEINDFPYEQCDGTSDDIERDWGNVRSCTDFGFSGGTLECYPATASENLRCRFDVSGCTGKTTSSSTTCSNAIANNGEQCDPLMFPLDLTCESFGLESTGTNSVSCYSPDETLENPENACMYNIENCAQPSFCGDNIAEGAEMCDGSDLRGVTQCTALSLAYSSGSLSCYPAGEIVDGRDVGCTYDISSCAICGDNTIQEPEEQCDGTTFTLSSCSAVDSVLGLGANYFIEGSGYLACYSPGEIVDGSIAGCTYDVSNCDFGEGYCGDGEVNNFPSEQCDGTDWAQIPSGPDAGCRAFGFSGGTLGCYPSTASANRRCTFNVEQCIGLGNGMCGNGALNSREQCDASSGSWPLDCADFGYDNAVGELNSVSCFGSSSPLNCTYDISGCLAPAKCGNRELEAGEECEFIDGVAQFYGLSCESLDFDGGGLACNPTTCTISTTGCTMCGNDVLEDGEQCDTSRLNGLTCTTFSYIDPLTGSSTHYSGGILECTDECVYDLSNCDSGQGYCGDDEVNDFPDEQCEGSRTDLVRDWQNIHTCIEFGFSGGTLDCYDENNDASLRCKFDTSACTPVNNIDNGCTINEADPSVPKILYSGEQCEAGIQNLLCNSFGDYPYGEISCDDSCYYDIGECLGDSVCGDTDVETDKGEMCDTTDPITMHADCSVLSGGLLEGTANCNAQCSGYDLSTCDTVPICGNGVLENDELCDINPDTGALVVPEGVDCSMIPGTSVVDSGILKCTDTCDFDTSNCNYNNGYCGDGLINNYGVRPWEQCDGNPGQTNHAGTQDYDWGDTITAQNGCAMFGMGTGTIRCNSDCRFDTSQCAGESNPLTRECGDIFSRLDPGDQCEPEHNLNLGCADFDGFGDEGAVFCNNDCTYNIDSCTPPVPPPTCGQYGQEDGEICDLGSEGGLLGSCAEYLDVSYYGSVYCRPVGDPEGECTIDYSGCSIAPGCSDGHKDVINEDGFFYEEECDGDSFGIDLLTGMPFDCSSFGSYGGGGILECTPDCKYDLENCDSGSGYCGDGELNNYNNENPNWEQCDGNPDDESGYDWGHIRQCSDFGFAQGGTLSCNPASDPAGERCMFDTSQCIPLNNNPNEGCGDTVPLGADTLGRGEQCENSIGENIGFALDCSDFNGFAESPLSCSGCFYDIRSCTAAAECEDDNIGFGEDCEDTINPEISCEAINGQGWIGTATCRNCHWDDSSCVAPPECGDFVVTLGEQCEPTDLQGMDCEDLSRLFSSVAPDGFVGGRLSCYPPGHSAECQWDISSCDIGNGYCGDNISNNFPYEQCDGTQDDGDWGNIDSCIDFGFSSEGSLSCYGPDAPEELRCKFDISRCDMQNPTTPSCGDSNLDEGEQCDFNSIESSIALGCVDFGYALGEIGCYESNSDTSGLGYSSFGVESYLACQYDVSGCIPQFDCSNGMPELGEECQYGEFQSCADYVGDPYYAGTVQCVDCRWDDTFCIYVAPPNCGDGVIGQGESCDGSNVGSFDCTDFGIDIDENNPGILYCNAECNDYDTTNCNFHNTGYCGDNIINDFYTEQCDGTLSGGDWGRITTCADFGFMAGVGTLTCNIPSSGEADRCKFNTTRCIPVSPNPYLIAGGNPCNDQLHMIDAGDQCEYRSDNNYELQCVDFDGFESGTIDCDPYTCMYDISECVAPSECNNSIVEPPNEECDSDGLVLCSEIAGYEDYEGYASCEECHYDTSGCTHLPYCGNNILETSNDEYCDGTSVAECTSLGPSGFEFIGGVSYCFPAFSSGGGDGEGSESGEGCTIDTSNCDYGYGFCGNGEIDNDLFEQCDGNPSEINPDGSTGHDWGDITTCADFGFMEGAGQLRCYSHNSGVGTRCTFDTSQCVPVNNFPNSCSNNNLDEGEQCDGSNVLGCDFFSNFTRGSTSCSGCSYDITGCMEPEPIIPEPDPQCGNGNEERLEQCDRRVDGAYVTTCADYYDNNELAGDIVCSGCSYDDSGCYYPPVCGNNDYENYPDIPYTDELCDGADLNGFICSNLGAYDGYYEGGLLDCDEDCSFDVSNCDAGYGYCGNGVIDNILGEQCDRDDWGDIIVSCENFGFDSGTLSCNGPDAGDNKCMFNTSQCTLETPSLTGCGRPPPYNTLSIGEQCEFSQSSTQILLCDDFSNYTDGDISCDSLCNYDISQCTGPVPEAFHECGNNALEAPEQCDINYAISTCQEFMENGVSGSDELYSGNVYCDNTESDGDEASCIPDFDECESIILPECGDGHIDYDIGEQCDGANLGGLSCFGLNRQFGTTFIQDSGVLSCYPKGSIEGIECTYDISRCDSGAGYCGDRTANNFLSEQCDGLDWRNISHNIDEGCQKFGFLSGTLSCNPPEVSESSRCMFNTSRCVPQISGQRVCGNFYLTAGEQCDNMYSGGLTITCADFGFDPSGTVSCFDPDDFSGKGCMYSMEGCSAPPECGDGLIETDKGEQCDFSGNTEIFDEFSGEVSCYTYGYDGGEIHCNEEGTANQCTLDISACAFCGNGNKDYGEECDGLDLGLDANNNEMSCQNYGYDGILLCNPDCTYNTENCDFGYGYCGNDRIDNLLREQCDGTAQDGDWGDISTDPNEGCQMFGFDTGGTLTCNPPSAGFDSMCRFNTSLCTKTYSRPQELRSCTGSDYYGEQSTIAIFDVGEQCEDSLAYSLSCSNFDGYYNGSLMCYMCDYYLDGCYEAPDCSNRIEEQGEECQPGDSSMPCGVLRPGYYGNAPCTDCLYDTSVCTPEPVCGDNYRDMNNDEFCDGTDIPVNCTDFEYLGYVGGIMGCTSPEDYGDGYNGYSGYDNGYGVGCDLDFSNCDFGEGYCGDGLINNFPYEQCDGLTFGSVAYGAAGCAQFGYDSGTLRCYPPSAAQDRRCRFDTTGCYNDGIHYDACGSSIPTLDYSSGEQCDGVIDNMECNMFDGFTQGFLSCVDCMYDISGCSGPTPPFIPVCNGAEREEGEICELNEEMLCSEFFDGTYYGIVTCSDDCRSWNTTGCHILPPEPVCGNNIRETDNYVDSVGRYEQCDGIDLGTYNDAPLSCANFMTNAEGILICDENCQFDTSNCDFLGQGYCGDNRINNYYLEQCDGNNTDGEWGNITGCEMFGFDGGTLRCYPPSSGQDLRCTFDTSGCTQDVPNIINPSCHGYSLDSGEQCEDSQTVATWLSCTMFDSFFGGIIGCDECRYNIDDCSITPSCGNGYIEETLSEQCDYALLQSAYVPCSSFDGYSQSGGYTSCTDSCIYDFSECSPDPICGDGYVDGWEDCEPSRGVGEMTCGLIGNFLDDSGTLSCYPSGTVVDGVDVGCTYDVSNCDIGYGYCGDGSINNFIEQCDGTNWGQVSSDPDTGCEQFGFTGGQLRCYSPTEHPDIRCTFDTRLCTTPAVSNNVCGNSILNPGEQCEGDRPIETLTCSYIDHYNAGMLGCNVDTCMLDISDCYVSPEAICGDGMINGREEQCDGANLGPVSYCTDLDSSLYSSGMLSCNPPETLNQCRLNTSSCIIRPEARYCGDGDANTDEEDCDGEDLSGMRCIDIGFQGGDLRCSDDCTFDTSRCDSGEGYCGDNRINNYYSEQCDGNSIDGDWGDISTNPDEGCVQFGFSGGELSCNNCLFDTSRCTTSYGGRRECNNNILNPSEQCEPQRELSQDALGCNAFDGFDIGTTSCNPDCTIDISGCSWSNPPVCGDGYVNDEGEMCDINDLGTHLYCTDFGSWFIGGALGCAGDCTYDYSMCVENPYEPTCGNGAIEGITEQCDLTLPEGMDCTKIDSYIGGILRCFEQGSSYECMFDVSDCNRGVGYCGDNLVNNFPNEECDGTHDDGDWGIFTPNNGCLQMGFTGGQLGCSGCLFDTSGCTSPAPIGRCGDSILNPGENCEQDVPMSVNCTDFDNFIGGSIACDYDLCDYDLSGCEQAPVDGYCGDNIINNFPGEQCDGNPDDGALGMYDWGNITSCSDIGFTGGTLECSNCEFDTSRCTSPAGDGFCGDGELNPGENCEPALLDGSISCLDFDDFSGGILGCNPNTCDFDITQCEVLGVECGDSIINGIEQCDGENIGAVTSCRDMDSRFMSGEITCSEDCMLDYSGCILPSEPVCGDTVVQPSNGEQCDGSVGQMLCDRINSYEGGILGCYGPMSESACQYDVSNCDYGYGYCGDNIINNFPYEQCDGNTWGSITSQDGCQSFGFDGGTIGCYGPDAPEELRCTFDTSSCYTIAGSGICGDSILNPYEQCESDIGLELTCRNFDTFVNGTLGCDFDFCAYDISDCTLPTETVCGDGVATGREVCDGQSMPLKYCSEYNSERFVDGLLNCTDRCRYDTSDCIDNESSIIEAVCGNNHVDEGEQCDGEYSAVSCQNFNYGEGDIMCNADCTADTSFCSSPLIVPGGQECGNSLLEQGEECEENVSSESASWESILGCTGGSVCEDCTIKCDIEDAPDHCANTVFDTGTESDVDCGIECSKCDLYASCITDDDCLSGICNDENICAQDHCLNGVIDVDESDMDCGGANCNACEPGLSCTSNDDCTSGLCEENFCVDVAARERNNALLVLISGLVISLAAGGYILVKTYMKPKRKGTPPPVMFSAGDMANQNVLAGQNAAASSAQQKKLADRLKEKENKRKSMLEGFDAENGEGSGGQDNSGEPKKVSPIDKDGLSKIEEKPLIKKDYLEMSDLHDDKSGKGQSQDTGKSSVFDKLAGIVSGNDETTGSELKDSSKGSSKVVSDDSSKGSSKVVSDDSSKVVSDDSSKGSSKVVSDDSSKGSSKVVSDDSIAGISGKTEENITGMLKSKNIDTKAPELFNGLDRDQLTSEVFKSIISGLVSSGKLSKESVSSILFEYIDKGVLSKRDVARIMSELGLV